MYTRLAAWARWFFALAAVVCAACDRNPAPPPPPPAPVTVARPVEREVIEWDDYSGRIEAAQKVEVRAQVSGLITEAPFVEGGLVEKGDLLFVIDPRPFEAELVKAKAELQRTEAQRAYAANEFKRLENLRPTGGASELELENARARLLEAEAQIAAAQAVVRTADLHLEWTRVTAEISGRVSSKNVTPGNLIQGGGPGESTLLTTVTSIDPIYAYVDVDERSVLKYQALSIAGKRQSARETRIPIFMGLSNEQGFPHEGYVDFVDNEVHPDTGTLRARGVFANANDYLKPGLFARLRVPGSGRYKTLLIPDLAVGTDQDLRFVLVVNRQDVVERRAIRLGKQFGQLRAVEQGLDSDDRVIINGVQRARPGTKVLPQEVQIEAPDDLTAPNSPTTQDLPATRDLPTTRPSTRPTMTTTAPATIGAAL